MENNSTDDSDGEGEIVILKKIADNILNRKHRMKCSTDLEETANYYKGILNDWYNGCKINSKDLVREEQKINVFSISDIIQIRAKLVHRSKENTELLGTPEYQTIILKQRPVIRMGYSQGGNSNVVTDVFQGLKTCPDNVRTDEMMERMRKALPTAIGKRRTKDKSGEERISQDGMSCSQPRRPGISGGNTQIRRMKEK